MKRSEKTWRHQDALFVAVVPNLRWLYQKRSKWARLRFSIAYQTIIPRARDMIHPVAPGPVRKLAPINPTVPEHSE